jgi:hypothetical protein
MLLELSRLHWGQLIHRPIGQLAFPFTASHDVHLFCAGVGKAGFRIQARANWKSETGNLDSQFPTPDFRPPESWLVNLDSGILVVLLFGLFRIPGS